MNTDREHSFNPPAPRPGWGWWNQLVISILWRGSDGPQGRLEEAQAECELSGLISVASDMLPEMTPEELAAECEQITREQQYDAYQREEAEFIQLARDSGKKLSPAWLDERRREFKEGRPIQWTVSDPARD